MKGVSQTIEKEAKQRKDGLISMSSGTLGASLLENILAGKGVIRAGKRTIRTNQDF